MNCSILFKSSLKSCSVRFAVGFISNTQEEFIWTWNGLKAEDSMNKADRERDEKRIWHLQSQVLRELAGSEVHIQAGRHTLKFQSPSLSVSVPGLLWLSSLTCLALRTGCPELAWLHWSSCGPHVKQTLSPLISLWVAFTWNTRAVTVPCAGLRSRGWMRLGLLTLECAFSRLTVGGGGLVCMGALPLKFEKSGFTWLHRVRLIQSCRLSVSFSSDTLAV